VESQILQLSYGVSIVRACQVLQCQRSTYYYQSVADEQAELKIRIRDIAQSRVSYGYRRIHVMLQREGWKINHKRVYRIYKQEGLMMRPKRPRRHVTSSRRMERPSATQPNECWSMDFMSDGLYNGQRIRLLTLVDNFTRESPAIELAEHLGGQAVVEILEQISTVREKPKKIRVDNGPEFTSKRLDQ
jgi:putative transposase